MSVESQINEFVDEQEGGWHEFDYAYPLVERTWVGGDKKFEDSPGKGLTVPNVGTIFYVDGYTGGEGGGSDAYQIILLRVEGEPDRYFRKDGFYASHYGSDWDGEVYEVTPVERTVTFYEKVN